MSVENLPVTDIEGIGPAAAGLLNAAQIFYTADLLRFSAEQIHTCVKSSSSLNEVEEWRSMASLLELRGMTGQWAEALVKGGVDTLEELFAKDLARLTAIFADAHSSRLIASVPESGAILDMVKDAAVVFYSGHSMGTVVDPDGSPLAGAVVTVGRARTETDERGRYRLIRIPAAPGHYLRIELPGYQTLFEPDFEVIYDCRAIRVQYRRLTPVGAQDQTVELDEYNGDELPGLGSYKPVSQSFPQEEIRQGDVFRVSERYASPHVKLVSIFRRYRAGDLMIRHTKVDLSRFTDAPAKGGLYHYKGGVFVKLSGSVRVVERYRALRKVRRSLRERPDFYQLDLAAQIDWLFKTYSEKNIFSRFRPVPSATP